MASVWDDDEWDPDEGVPDRWDAEDDTADPVETTGIYRTKGNQQHYLKGLDQNLNLLSLDSKNVGASIEDDLTDSSDDSDGVDAMGRFDDDSEESSEESSSDEDEDGDDVKFSRQDQKCIDGTIDACNNLYINAPRINLNLMHDFTESDLFTIDGDSILADIFTHEGLDFTHGGQLLHFVYLVELFFQDFQKREGQFHIVFFTQAECLWHSDPLKLLARRMIIQHLKKNTNTKVITHIADPFSDGWTKYIKMSHPAFLMISDGESLKKRKGRRLIIRALLLSAVKHKLDVAFCSSINRSLRSVNTFYVEARRAARCISSAPMGHPKTYFLATQFLTSGNAKVYSSKEMEMICGQFQSVINQYPDNLHMLTTCRDIITAISCAEILRNHNDEIDRIFSEGMTQAFILHCVLLQYLSLDARAQNLPDDACISPYCEGLVKKYLRNLHYAMAKVITSFEVLYIRLKDVEAVKSTESLADLMDGRLLHVVLYLMQNYTENKLTAFYPEEVISKFKYLWQITLDLQVTMTTHTNNPQCLKSTHDLPDDKVLFKAPVHIYTNTSDELKSKKSLAKNRKGLVKVSSRLATDYAGGLLQELASDTTTNLKSISAKPKRFIENYHWHSGKPLRDDYENTRESEEKLSSDPRERKKQLERKQKFARYMQNYGESLEGRARGLRQQTITLDLNNAGAKKKVSHQGQKKAKKTETKSVKEKILEEKKLKDQEKADEDATSRWASILPDLMANAEDNKYEAVLKNIDNFLRRCASDKMTVEALLAKMDCYWKAWKGVNAVHKVDKLTTKNQSSLFSDLTPTHPMYYSIMLFVCCQEILDYHEILGKKQLKLVAAYIKGLGFTAFAKKIEGIEAESTKMGSSKPVFSRVLPTQDECPVGMSCTRFQLQFVGQWMKRDERSDKDPRVTHFIPDTWQRELLDAVDNNESALIVAPTSSGKTYASYYCMEKVLRQGNDGVVVYVSPTKALMNQVSATVYARFTKKLPPGRVICGVFSRDFRRNALDCQILVTVPQCLEILLLSPRRQEWAKRIQYVIFDEVHCLGGEIGAEVWEHLLVTIKCPFLALSATVRNPEDIKGWLQESQHFKKTQAEMVSQQTSTKKKAQPHSTENNAYNVKLVVYRERHSDLEKFIYLPDAANRKRLLMPNDACLQETKGFVALHPVAMLNLTKVKAQGLPADLSLSPREALVLYDVMKAIHPSRPQIKELDPEVYFQNIPVLKKQDARKYEKDLKEELMRWVSDGHDDKVEKVICELSDDVDEKLSKCKQTWRREGMFTDRVAVRTYAKLIRQLNEQRKLPALVFSQQRKLCENLAEAVADSLEQAEEELREQFEDSPLCREVEKIMDRLEKQAKKRKNTNNDIMEKRKPNNKPGQDDGNVRLRGRREKEISDSWSKKPPWRRRGAQNRRKGQRNIDADAERFADCLNEADDPEDRRKLMEAKYFLLDDPLPSCTLQGEGNLSQEEVDEILADLPYDDTSNNLRWLISRGVAYHHAGLNNKQRVAVETLFRMKHLKVVSATATLALGIHMPCKTVVFVCEDLWLKPLAFRQMSGRSGRRGFDLVGNVIFHCVPEQKIQHLITSGLPHLRGHFPFSVSLVLRLMVLTHNSEDKRNAHEKALSLLKHPFVCHKAKGMEEVVQHFFLFSVDYLIRVGLLESDGTPIGLSGLATHLHYHEPANLTFVSMLQEGAFHKLCKPSADGSFSSDVMETMVIILAQMFNRMSMPMSTFRRRKNMGIHSKVVFGKDLLMPPEFSSVLKRHNQDVMKVFRRYIQTVCDYAAQTDSVQQNVLPLSEVVIEPSTAVSNSSTEEHSTNVMQRLSESANQSSTLSPFVMTSGHSDEDLAKFDLDISQAIRQGVHIETTKIPTLQPPSELRDNRGKLLFINAYVYDFYKHGSKKLIGRENGLDSGEVFDKLNDFKLVIAAISVALDELGPGEDNVVLAFRKLKKEYGGRFKQEFPHARD